MDKFKEIITVFRTPLLHNQASIYKTSKGIGIVCTPILLLMTIINFRLHYNTIGIATTLLFIAFGFCTILALLERWLPLIQVIICSILIIIFSDFVIIGGNKGFAALWILLVPYAIMTVWGTTCGLIVSTYFLIFLIFILWTPMGNALLQYSYTDVFIERFPILYLLCFTIAFYLSYQFKKYKISEERRKQELQLAVDAEHERVKNMALQTISAISKTMDAKDPATNQHSERVAKYSVALAKALHWNDKDIRNLHQAARLHDIGKIGVADKVLNKPDKLTDEEYALMKNHTIIGKNILSNLSLLQGITNGAYYHHEHYDGSGYPQGLSGHDIPIEARIIGICDAVDAISSQRVYKSRRDDSYVLDQLTQGKGTQFDPELAALFIQLIENGTITL